MGRVQTVRGLRNTIAGIPWKAAFREIMVAHLALAVFCSIVGYWAGAWIADKLASSAMGSVQQVGPIAISSSSLQMWGIFIHNIIFFLVVSLFPIVNSLVIAFQFLIIGAAAALIAEQPFSIQMTMLYRHTFLEIIALLITACISYVFLFSTRDFTKASVRNVREFANRLLLTIPLYGVIVVMTLAGAILEGSAVVHL